MKEKTKKSEPAQTAIEQSVNNVVQMPPVSAQQTNLKLNDLDKMSLEVAKANNKAARAQAEKAIAQSETADMTYKYIVLQIYMKYGLSGSDAISEDGSIIIGGAVQGVKNG